MSEDKKWNGTGTPPVGTICEVLARRGHSLRWQEAEVLKFMDNQAAVRILTTDNLAWVTKFRPVQDEEEQLFSFLREQGLPVSHARTAAEALLDAGLSGVDLRNIGRRP